MDEEIKLYAIRNSEGKWFRRKGYGGWGESWTDKFSAARIFNKIGYARTQVTFFARRWPEYGVPELVELKVTESSVIDETDRVAKVLGG